jgi:hypothetical protein
MGASLAWGTLSSSAHLALRPVQRRLILAMLTCSAEAVYLENILMTSATPILYGFQLLSKTKREANLFTE